MVIIVLILWTLSSWKLYFVYGTLPCFFHEGQSDLHWSWLNLVMVGPFHSRLMAAGPQRGIVKWHKVIQACGQETSPLSLSTVMKAGSI